MNEEDWIVRYQNGNIMIMAIMALAAILNHKLNYSLLMPFRLEEDIPAKDYNL